MQKRVPTPQRSGWFWIWVDGLPFKPTLRYVNCHGMTEPDPDVIHVHRHNGHPERWSTALVNDRISQWEMIGERMPGYLIPSKPGFYWITSRFGYKSIIQVCAGETRNGVTEWKVWVIGRPTQYGIMHVIEAYDAIRLDFIAEADEAYPEFDRR